jgi:hypothetical protein
MAKGVVRPPSKGEKRKKKVLVFWGWLDHPQGPGVASATLYGRCSCGRRVAEATPGPWRWSGHPQKTKTHSFFLFLAFWGLPDHPFHHEGGLTTLIPAVRVALATPCPKMGWFSHPILAKAPPPISSSSFFFLKKKKKI